MLLSILNETNLELFIKLMLLISKEKLLKSEKKSVDENTIVLFKGYVFKRDDYISFKVSKEGITDLRLYSLCPVF
ncbi:hypothetical protein [Jeotgalibacillus proteolyticus]|uniref:Uncharacterized protein n=1 Tax=Jeotgalibacillus proteolyticus TaxID=2082395 RepID=A0A2S5G7I7_9BACL|nr:hypothetical protein [Jeotgalibacillus proteolyticus]PPA68949.1 hypothetical protein C4B60_18740 [Jeotgalibacillus proteolyticus]